MPPETVLHEITYQICAKKYTLCTDLVAKFVECLNSMVVLY